MIFCCYIRSNMMSCIRWY